jgi:hypothetical protein
MERLDSMAALTGQKGVGQLVRAAIGWQYENLDF